MSCLMRGEIVDCKIYLGGVCKAWLADLVPYAACALLEAESYHSWEKRDSGEADSQLYIQHAVCPSSGLALVLPVTGWRK